MGNWRSLYPLNRGPRPSLDAFEKGVNNLLPLPRTKHTQTTGNCQTFYVVFYPLSYQLRLSVFDSVRLFYEVSRIKQRTSMVFVVRCRSSERWRCWVRHCATGRKVTGSFPDGVIGIILPAALWSWG